MTSPKTQKPKNGLIDVGKIRDLCEARGLSIAELGRRIGFADRQKMNARLQNVSAITGDELLLIAAELNVPAEALRA